MIKFDEQNGGFVVFSAINNSTDPANPTIQTILTSMNDDSVGEIIDGSSGQPQALQQDPICVFTNYIELKNFHFMPAEVAFQNYVDGSINVFWNCEFSGCGETIDLTCGKVVLRNVLNCAVNFYGSATDGDQFWDPYVVDAQNVTSATIGHACVINGGVVVGMGCFVETI